MIIGKYTATSPEGPSPDKEVYASNHGSFMHSTYVYKYIGDILPAQQGLVYMLSLDP